MIQMHWFYVTCYAILQYPETAERPDELSPKDIYK